MIAQSELANDLGVLIANEVPVLDGHILLGPHVQAPVTMTLAITVGAIGLTWDGMEVASYDVEFRLGVAWQPAAPYYPVHVLLEDTMRAVYESLKTQVVIGDGEVVVTGSFLITPPTVGLERPAAIDNIVTTAMTAQYETKEGLTYAT